MLVFLELRAQSKVSPLLLFWFFLGQLGHLTLEDYQIWSVSSALANEFLNLLFQVGPLHPGILR